MEKLLSNQYGVFALAFVAFLVAAILVYVFVRTLLGGKLRLPGGRARQARLGIVDAFDLDRQRQLIIVRRDNTEHLIMIGGPNDLLIEAEIIRVEAREPRGRAGEPGFGDARIPAPYTPGGPEPRGAGDSSPADEPLLPIALPEVPVAAPPEAPIAEPAVAAPTTPARGPTFPLPPRRPTPTPLERRSPLPPRLPDGPGRETPPAGEAPAVVPAAPSGEAPAAPPPAPPLSAGPRPAPTLRPLPPRPPMRPLQRTTPRPPAPNTAATPPSPPVVPPPVAPPPVSPPIVPGTVPPVDAAPPPEPAAVATPHVETAPPPPPPAPEPPAAPPPPPPPPAAPPPPAPESAEKPPEEDLSLEEEMAKLLGRN